MTVASFGVAAGLVPAAIVAAATIMKTPPEPVVETVEDEGAVLEPVYA